MKDYIIKTSRLGLRQWQASDKIPFAELNSDPIVMEHFPKVLSSEESDTLHELLKTHFEEHGFTYFAVDEVTTDQFIGFIGMKHQTYEANFTPAIDIGWRLLPAFWGKGYATEGAKACLDNAKEQFGIEEIISVCTHTNTSSEKVMHKLGMQRAYSFDHPALDPPSELNPCVLYKRSLI